MSHSLAKHQTRWAIVLGGGRSRRMGADKATLPLGSQTLLQHVEQAFLTFADRVIVVTTRDRPTPIVGPNTIVLHDENMDLGPLEGLRIGMAYCQDKTKTVMVGTCDSPLVVPEFYRVLADHLQDGDAAVPRIDTNIYPLSAIYQTAILPLVETRIQERRLRVTDLLMAIDTRWVDRTPLCQVDPELQTICNVNTPSDYQNLLQLRLKNESASEPPVRPRDTTRSDADDR